MMYQCNVCGGLYNHVPGCGQKTQEVTQGAVHEVCNEARKWAKKIDAMHSARPIDMPLMHAILLLIELEEKAVNEDKVIPLYPVSDR